MPITMQKTRSYKQETKPVSGSNEEDQTNSCLSKFTTRAPVALILLLLIFLWSSSTTLITGSIVHVCVTTRKLNNHLYCLSAGDQSAAIKIPDPSGSLSKSITEGVSLTKNVESPSIATQPLTVLLPPANDSYATPSSGEGAETKETRSTLPTIIRLPVVANNSSAKDSPGTQTEGEKKKDPKNKMTSHVSEGKTPASVIRLPLDGSSVTKPPSGDGDVKSKNVTAIPAPITIMEKIENKTNSQEEIAIARKDVEEQMEVLRSYKKAKAVNYSDPEACDGRGIYVYDLPTKFNKDLLGHCGEMITWLDFCKFFSNNAFGEAVPQLGNGWYNTHQYSLEPIFHARVLKHPCRVHDPEKAKLFYVPYYGGFDILRWHFKQNTTVEQKDKLSYELIEWLNQHKSWKRNFGLDHLFVLGKITWDFRRVDSVGWGTKFLDLDEMQNPMKLLIERQPWQINDIGVPHPSFFHPRSDDDIIAWQKKLMQMPRKNLVSFVGAPRPNDTESIRSILISQCTASPSTCHFLDCRENRCTNTQTVVETLTDSEFCLQPPGDSPTRKSVFDSLVAGCIPVLFDPFTAYYQYPWHLPGDRSAYSVFVDQGDVRKRKVDVVERLAAVTEERRKEMRRRIVYEVLPGLVYGDPEGRLERFRDAFSVAIDGVVERMMRLP